MSFEMSDSNKAWHRKVVIAACFHCGLWGAFIIVTPELSWRIYGFADRPHDIHLWQGTGLFILLLAIGYGMAAWDLRQHWGIVVVGLLAKALGAAGMSWAVWQGRVSSQVLWLLPLNDLIWIWPFWRIVQAGMNQSR